MAGITAELEKQGNASDKEFILALYRKRKISYGAARALAKRYAELAEQGRKNPLGAVFKEFDAGKMGDVADKADGKASRPQLADAPKNASPKQKLVFLFQGGSVTANQVRQAAKFLDAQSEAGDPLDVAAALHAAGATHLLPEKLQAAIKKAEAKATGIHTLSLEMEDVQFIEIVHSTKVEEVVEWLEGIEDRALIESVHIVEQANPDYEGGRKGILDAAEERLGELEVEEEESGPRRRTSK